MSPPVKAGLVFGLLSVLTFIGGILIAFLPIINLVIAYGSLLALGYGAGYTAAKVSNAPQGGGVGRGALAGTIAGIVNLLAMTILLGVLASLLTQLPGMQDIFAQAQAQNPGQPQVPITGGLLGAGGAVAGFCFGLINLIIMLVGGLIGGAVWKGAPQTVGAQQYSNIGQNTYTMGTPPPPGTYTPPTDDDTNARIYPDNQR